MLLEKQNKIIKALVDNHGFSQEKAIDLICKHNDVVEVNQEESAEYIAIQLEEQYMQED